MDSPTLSREEQLWERCEEQQQELQSLREQKRDKEELEAKGEEDAADAHAAEDVDGESETPNQAAKHLLPAWFWQENAHESFSLEVGPAITWLRIAALLVAAVQGLVLMYLHSTLACPMDGGVPHYSMVVWIGIAPAFIFGVFAQLYGLSLYLTPYAMKTTVVGIDPFVLPVFGAVSFEVWLVVAIILTMLSWMDVVTDTLFTGVYMKALQCNSGHRLEDIWRSTLAQSLFGKLGMPLLNLRWLILSCWALSILQVLLPILMTLRSGSGWAYVRGDRGSGTGVFGGTSLNHEQVFEDLADASCSAGLQQLSIRKAKAHSEAQHGAGRLIHAYIEPTSSALLKRVVLSFLLENGLQVQLQATMFAIHQYIGLGHMSRSGWQSLSSIVLGILLTCTKVTEVMSFRSIAQTMERKIEEQGGDDAVVMRQASDRREETRQSLTKLRRNIIFIYAGSTLTFLLLAYAVVKLVAAFYCPDSMVNVTGCVVMPKDDQ